MQLSTPKQMRQLGLIALGISITAVLLLAWGQARTDTASADGSAMSLSAPDPVILGETFPLTINAAPAPDVEIAGFAAEVLFPAGLEYSGSDDCQEEIQVERVDAGLIAFCLSTLTGSGGRGINVNSEVAAPPLEPLDLPLGASGVPLATFAFTCTAVGDYKVTLTSNPASPDGALYADVNASPIGVKTETQDGGDVADSLTINCVEAPPAPTPTNTPTAAATGTATPVTPTATPTTAIGAVSAGVGGIGGDGGGAGLWVVVATLLAAAAAGLAVQFGRRYAHRSR